MTHCAAYMRCSGDAQIQGDTWNRQELAISQYASSNDLVINKFFRDEGVTGKMELEGRAGLSACIEYVREHKISILLIEDATRMARDMVVAEVIIREFQRMGVTVIAASGGINLTEGDDSNPTAKLIRQILAAVSEWERCVITLKLRGARERIREKEGRCEGKKSFGSKPGEAETLQEMQNARMHGYTFDRIAQLLNHSKAPTRTGKPWRGSVVAKILQRGEM